MKAGQGGFVDKAGAGEHVSRMRGAPVLIRLACTVLLTIAGMVMGAASEAHQGHAPSDPLVHVHDGNESPPQASGEAVVPIAESQDAGPVHHESVPCSGGDGTRHMVGCCTVLCHAALMAPAFDGAQRSQPRFVALPTPAQALVGLSGSGMDRPPKRS